MTQNRPRAFLFLCFLLTFPIRAEPSWEILRTEETILIDGFLEDWKSVPALVLSSGSPGVRTNGHFGTGDLTVTLRALWDPQKLYLAVEWNDNLWDVQKVLRRDAVWVTENRQRRDRMHFFDNLKFHIEKFDYNYIMWVSPRLSDRGPFLWHRLLKGARGMEAAVSPPMVTGRFQSGVATLEIVLDWDDLDLKPEGQGGIPLILLLADSDLPGKILETKLTQLKWLEWSGQMTFSQTTHEK